MELPRISKPTLSASGLRAFESIAERWRLNKAERLNILGIPKSTYDRLRSAPNSARLDGNTLERISHILGVYKALHVLFADDEQADTWIDRPSDYFGGEPARKRLTTGTLTDVIAVRRYLDAARG